MCVFKDIVFFLKKTRTTRKHAMGTGWKHPSAPVFQPVPPNRDQWRLPKTPGISSGALGFHWHRLEIPTGAKAAAMLTQGGSPFGTGWSFQPVSMIFSLFFPNLILFVIFITVYSFIIAKRTRPLQYYTFIGRTYAFVFREYLKLTKSEMRAYN